MNSNARIIKRYANRKLYDTFQSCYITLEEMSQIIREGNEIVVIDNKTKGDITYKTLLQVLCEIERKSLKPGDVPFLNKVIRSTDGTFTGYTKELEGGSSDEVAPVVMPVVESEPVSVPSFN